MAAKSNQQINPTMKLQTKALAWGRDTLRSTATVWVYTFHNSGLKSFFKHTLPDSFNNELDLTENPFNRCTWNGSNCNEACSSKEKCQLRSLCTPPLPNITSLFNEITSTSMISILLRVVFLIFTEIMIMLFRPSTPDQNDSGVELMAARYLGMFSIRSWMAAGRSSSNP